MKALLHQVRYLNFRNIRAMSAKADQHSGFNPVPQPCERAILDPLPFAYDALEPHISKEIMTLHHDKHHQTYVDKYNAAADEMDKARKNGCIATQLKVGSVLKFNGGGVVNHNIFWKSLTPPIKDKDKPEEKLGKAIEKQFSSFENFKKLFNDALLGIQGSGWAWLVQSSSGLRIVTTQNQDTVTEDKVLFGVDAWEHAYYPQYKNEKQKYFTAIWNVINWKYAEDCYKKAIAPNQ